jgi:L-alanine-DL-glutamate epimerase-like enolase superfamily enzyme
MGSTTNTHTAVIDDIEVSAYTIPTSSPEADGTYQWTKTTLVLVQARSGEIRGTGYGYADIATAALIEHELKKRVVGEDAFSPQNAFVRMVHGIRNLGRPGISSMAISAVDIALWDLKARLLNLPLVTLLGTVRSSVPVYGSGGFTSYTNDQLREQLACWVGEGIQAVKMKIGQHPKQDLERVAAARDAIGEAELFVDANGAYSRKQALSFADAFVDFDVSWFEEPVSSDDLAGLRQVREHGPHAMDIAAGEYGYDIFYFRRMLEANAVDVLQADATRCGGVTGFLKAAELCDAFGLPLSAHTSPSIHGHLCCVASRARNVEYFHDHVRIERMLFDGALTARQGELVPDASRPGLGLEWKSRDAERFQVYQGDAA